MGRSYIRNPDGLLWRSPGDGSDKLQLTAAPVGAAMPRWSPDGAHIVYICQLPAKTPKVCTIARDGSDVQEIQPSGSNYPDDPQRSPDSKYAYFQDIGADGPEIDRVSISTRKKERLASLKGVARVNMPESGAPWNGVALDGSPLIMRDVGNRDIYALELQLP